MTKVLFNLLRGPDDKDPQVIHEYDLPEVPAKGDNYTISGRAYKVLERAWVLEFRKLEGELCPSPRCNLLVMQIAGPPHALRSGLIV